jgi:hypothetical protein
MVRQRIDPRRIEVVDDAVAEILMCKTHAERLALAFDANRTVRSVVEGAIRSDHPDWDDTAVRRELARRMLHGTT